MKTSLILILLFTLSLQFAVAQTADPADQIVGVYWGPLKDGKVEIYKRGAHYAGKIVEEKVAAYDRNNPDPLLKDRPLLGVNIFTNFDYYAPDKQWLNGKVYDPKDGKSYDCKLWLENEGKTLVVRGFIGVSFFGRTERMERVK
jgi:uncharacterized protein (DUF2147 family)